MSARKERKKRIEVNIEGIKRQLSELVKEKYGSVRKFEAHEDAKTLGIEKSVRTILSSNKNSLPVINKLCTFFAIPKVSKRTKRTTTVTYYTIDPDEHKKSA